MIQALLLMLASLMGAGGVVLLAASAHAAKDAGLDSAGAMLLFHANASSAPSRLPVRGSSASRSASSPPAV
jgi:uncharacterized membrane protein YgdD (TMEM256/DUF423 family)